MTSTGARAHYCLGRAVPVLAMASSGVGERQEGVKGVGTMIVAKFGKARQAGKRARDQQRLGRVADHVGRMPARLDERGHRMNSDLMPT